MRKLYSIISQGVWKSNISYFIIVAMMSAMGLQLFTGDWLVFVFFALFLIDRDKMFGKEALILYFFVAYLYQYYANNYAGMVNTPGWNLQAVSEKGDASEILMIVIAYLLGLSSKGIFVKGTANEKRIFYLLYAVFIAYIFCVIYSSFALPQDAAYPSLGMRLVCYVNKGVHFHSGRLISTIEAYYLSLVSMLLPFLFFYIYDFRSRKFTYFEIVLLIVLSSISFYFAIQMERRMTLLLSLLIFIYLTGIFAWHLLKNFGKKHSTVLLIAFLMILGIAYYLIQDTPLAKKIAARGLGDHRSDWWLLGFQYMYHYPWGGADMMINYLPWTNRVHNTWIDIGKSFGIPAFVAIVTFYLLHIRYMFHILRSKQISSFMKSLLLMISIGLFANLMVEPTYHTQKVFFYYSLFFLGFLKMYADFYTDKAVNDAGTQR